MKFKINEIRLNALTDSGPFGAKAAFGSGLNIFWADNSMGKSTSVQGLIYALGLEKMLSPQGSIPLPHAMTNSIEEDIDGGTIEHPVLASEVWLELENGLGETISIRRSVVGQDNAKLVSVWNTNIDNVEAKEVEKQEYFVKDPGSATREAGFHKFLADFLGLNLPLVQRYSGGEALLYLECLFPLFIVEQKRGWTGIQANLPKYMGLKDVGKRAIEYIAKLDIFHEEQEREKLNTIISGLRKRWKEEVEIAGLQVEAVGGYLTNVLDDPPSDSDALLQPSAEFREDGNKFDLHDLITSCSKRLEHMELQDISNTKDSIEVESARLEKAQGELEKKESLFVELDREITIEEALIGSLNKRISALQEDERKHKDLLKLQKMGADISLDEYVKYCPTCSQKTSSVLYLDEDSRQIMSIEENVDFIREQKETFQVMLRTSSSTLKEKRQIARTLVSEVSDLQSEIRSLKTLLVEDDRVPSSADIRRRVVLEQKIKMLNGVVSRVSDLKSSLGIIMNEWLLALKAKSKLRTEGLSELDKRKIKFLEKSYRSQIEQYNLKSVRPESISISRDTFKPVKEGFNLGFDLSASDNIRSIWAYLLAFVEMAREFETNHPGLLILDEPRQQSTNKVSFSEFLSRASWTSKEDQQVILATSENFDSLSESLEGLDHNLVYFKGRVLQRIKD